MTTPAATNDDSPPAPRQAAARHVAEVLLIMLVFFTVAGDPPPHVNETHYLTRLKHYWNPQWCAGDLFLESADTQLLLIWMFGWVTQWAPLAATAWIGRLAAWMLLAWAWQRLSWRIVPTPLAAVLSAALFVTLNSIAHLAGEWVVGGVEAKCFAYGFVLLAVSELIDRRWNRLWLLLGAATAFHPLVGGWSAVVCGGIWLLDDRRSGPWSSMLPGLAGGFVLGLIGILPALSLTWNESPDVVAEANRIYVFERLPHHLALLSLPGDESARRLIRHGLLLVALAGVGGAVRRTAVRRCVWFAWGAVALAVAGLVIEMLVSHEPLLAAQLLRYYWYRLTDFAAPLAVALAATVLIAAGLTERKKWATPALVAAILLSGFFIASVVVQRRVNPVPPADARMADFNAWVDVCRWVSENTPSDALFLTPRLNHSFKWRTGRPEVVNRKDIPQDARSIVEWHRRLRDIYYYQDADEAEYPMSSLSRAGTERVRELAHKYGADFVLEDRDQLLSLRIAYRNEEYVVYRIGTRTAADGR